MPETEQKPDSEKIARKELTNKKILAFSLEFGLMIVIPLLVCALGGKWLAQKFDNQAYFYGGVVLALLISFAWFWKKITEIYNDFIN